MTRKRYAHATILAALIAVSMAILLRPTTSIAEDQITSRLVSPPPTLPDHIDLDAYLSGDRPHIIYDDSIWTMQLLPDGLIYKSYLAGAKESRNSAHIMRIVDDSWIMDATLGARVGIARFGNRDRVRPRGVQFDVEASGQLRLDITNDVDVRSFDGRAGASLSYGDRWQQFKLGYYHISSHLADEFLAVHPKFPVNQYLRDVFIFGYSIYACDDLRIYCELGYAWRTDVGEPWEFQFGVDYAPAYMTGPRGAPFVAFNAHLREEHNFGGNVVFQAGWAWRGDANAHLLRAGLHYFNGLSNQFAFFDQHEQQIGFGLWYDF